MGKSEIDDILSELGVSGADAPPAQPRPRTPLRRHRVDGAESAFTPIPAVPSGQRSFGEEVRVENDPAVPVPPRTAEPARVGELLSSVYEPDAADAGASAADLEDLLRATGAASEQQLAAAHQVVRQSPGRRLVDVLLEQGCDEARIQQAVAQRAGVPFEHIDLGKGLDGGFDGRMLQRLTPEFCKQQLVLPLRTEGSRVVIGVTRPDEPFLLDEVRRRLGTPAVKVVVVTGFEVRGALEILGGAAAAEEQVDVNQILAEVEETDVQVEKKASDEVDLEGQANDSPVIKYVNHIIQQAVREGASDIHIEPAEKRLKVRFRIDGELYETMNPPGSMSAAITSRLKIMANLDISERRLPQDGRIRCQVQGRKLDLRMSTIPAGYGEKTVLRILDTRSINVQLEDLGFEENTLTIWKRQIDAPHGILLVTGPTGSGKTTTLYSSLRQLDKNTMNVSTVEDPIEYHLDGITQTQTHEKIGMTFAVALRALLRQDPDVIMLGEIRDHETALIAVQAALTGHLVLSTLHTNDAPGSITRLVNIGLEPFLVGAAVNGVLAQRLVRRLCVHCKSNESPGEEREEFLRMQGMDPDGVFVAKGCDRCRKTGYSGRVGIYELLMVDDQLRDLIAGNPNVAEFRRVCIERGMVTLRDDGMRKVARGMTTVEEVLRATEAH